MKHLTDETLIARFSTGDACAFDVLLSRYRDKVYGYIYTLVQNHEECEDIFQETFAKAIVTIRNGQYNEQGKFIAYLLHVARNFIIDRYRRTLDVEMISPQDVGYDIYNDPSLCDANIEESISYQDLLSDVRRMLAELPSDQQEIIRLHYYEGLSYKETARILGISINTALGRMRYAIHNLRNIARRHKISLAV